MLLVDLPVDILVESLLPRLDISSLTRLSETCWYLNDLCNDERLWRGQVEADYPPSIRSSKDDRGYKALYRRLKDVQVYTWGENSDKRLGFNDQDNVDRDTFMRQITTPRELRSLRSKGIVEIVAGGWSFHALDRCGRVWMWGWMQPKHPFANEGPVNHNLVRNPTLVQLPPDVHIQSIASGRSHAIALDQNGHVWHWANCWQPNRVYISTTKSPVKQITANWNHSTVLTTAGEVYLVPFPGIRPITINDPPVTIQRAVQEDDSAHQGNDHAFRSVQSYDQFVQIAGMEKSTLIISRLGRVFKFKTDKRNLFPTCPPSFFVELVPFGGTSTGSSIISISAQSRHFAVCTADKVLLGSQDDPPDSLPTELSAQGHKIYKVTFGDWHFGALTKQGKLLTWGRYSSGALGHGFDYNEVSQESPQLVEALDGMFIVSAGFGGYHSGCIALPLC